MDLRLNCGHRVLQPATPSGAQRDNWSLGSSYSLVLTTAEQKQSSIHPAQDRPDGKQSLRTEGGILTGGLPYSIALLLRHRSESLEMLHRHTEVKFRDNQENRVQHFPKTPKNAVTQSSKFVTPAPKPRIALGAKSTNVHHRQFTSAKTGKRHSPVTASKRPVETSAPARATELKGGAALRAALDRALLTGIDVPDVERCPEPVDELPYEEPESYEPLPWSTINTLIQRAKLRPLVPSYTSPPADKEPIFVPMEQPTTTAASGRTISRPRNREIVPDGRTKKMTEARHGSSRLGGFAAPTAAAKAKTKGPHDTMKRTKSSTTSSVPQARVGHRARPQETPGSLTRQLSSLELQDSAPEFLFNLPEPELAELPEIDTTKDMKIDWDFED